MTDSERFPQEKFQPILEQSMLLDSVLQAEEVEIVFRDIKQGRRSYQDLLWRHIQGGKRIARLFSLAYHDM